MTVTTRRHHRTSIATLRPRLSRVTTAFMAQITAMPLWTSPRMTKFRTLDVTTITPTITATLTRTPTAVSARCGTG